VRAIVRLCTTLPPPTGDFVQACASSISVQCVRMPRTTPITPALNGVLRTQDGLVTVQQLAAHGFDRHAVYERTRRGHWRRALPGVLLTQSGTPTRRQLVIAAWLWAGPEAAIDGASACAWYGLRPEGLRLDKVHVASPLSSGLRSRDFVVVRRTVGDIHVGGRTLVPYVEAATAVIVAARSLASSRSAVSLLSRALQTNLVTVADLHAARHR
jgi:hypothetical protein